MSSLLFTKSYQITNNWTVNKNETLKISQTWYIFLIFRLTLDWAYFILKTGAEKKHDILEIQTLSKTKQILRCIYTVISLQRFFFHLPSPSWRNLRSSIWQQWGDCLLCEKAPNCRLFDTHLLPIEQQSKLAMF